MLRLPVTALFHTINTSPSFHLPSASKLFPSLYCESVLYSPAAYRVIHKWRKPIYHLRSPPSFENTNHNSLNVTITHPGREFDHSARMQWPILFKRYSTSFDIHRLNADGTLSFMQSPEGWLDLGGTTVPHNFFTGTTPPQHLQSSEFKGDMMQLMVLLTNRS